MGLEESIYEDKDGNDISYWTKKGGSWASKGGELKYHSSWDWLMPVVEKIEDTDTEYGKLIYNMDGAFEMEKIYRCVFRDTTNLKVCSSNWNADKLKSVYDAVVKFITFHNSHNSIKTIQ
jgi:hypothetical protein